ncbi:uncharacterized protein LOC124888935 [Capsicum annuum]|uniref:uncharacterized protein LOC124888935 n=1 Tax=Capsicum annuum TaxID=4072 RepID=UPI001FB09527|nr:uncharacterized protein LOC124888935 [Capsicum annuum]
MVDRSVKRPVGILYDVLVKVSSFIFPVEFVILDCDMDFKVPIILGRPFLVTRRVLIYLECNEVKLRLNDEEVSFDMCQSIKQWKEMSVVSVIDVFYESDQEQLHFKGDSFYLCLVNLGKALQQCEEFNLVLNWEKFHFMVKESILLEHKISAKGIKVDRSKIEVIEKLPLPISVKEVYSFLGHDEKLVVATVIIALDWSKPFRVMCDASGVALEGVLGKKKEKFFCPIYYASKGFNGVKKNYTVTE